MNRIHNFSAGPAVMPVSVLERAQAELLDFRGEGMSIMEMSHRSKTFEALIEKTEADLRELLGISDDYAVLFLQGGASMQFNMLPYNLLLPNRPADVLLTGIWTQKAVKEINKLGDSRIVASSEDRNFSYIPKVSVADFNSDASFAFLTSNNTIYGTQFADFPDTGDVPLVADMSSDILSRPLIVDDFGVIFAGAQKNIGPSGVTLVIIRKDLAECCDAGLPSMLQYRSHIKAGSLYNTIPTFGVYMIGLVLEWLKAQGGLTAISAKNDEKAGLLYAEIESNPFYYTPVQEDSRSVMNVVFRISGDKEDLEKTFVTEALDAGISGIKGHRSVGGLRASIYNALPRESVVALVDFMKNFAAKYG